MQVQQDSGHAKAKQPQRRWIGRCVFQLSNGSIHCAQCAEKTLDAAITMWSKLHPGPRFRRACLRAEVAKLSLAKPSLYTRFGVRRPGGSRTFEPNRPTTKWG